MLIDTSSWPVVQFSKSLLNLTDSGDIAEVKAYLSVPQLLEDSFQKAPGIMESTSGMCVSLDEPVVTDFNLFPDLLFTLGCHLVSKLKLFKDCE